MRSRYYNPDIKRFINQDVLIGSIGNSNSLNRYSYVEGNPISYTDPFGLSPYKYISLGIHTALDILGIWLPGADVINAFYYLFEGEPGEFGKSLMLAIPGSDFLGKGTKFASKMGKYSKATEGVVKGVNAAGHIGSAFLMAYETGSGIGNMIDKYLVYDNELSKETILEVGLIVIGGYGTSKYAGMLSKYTGGLGGSVRPAKVTGDAVGTSTKVVDVATDSAGGNQGLSYQLIINEGGTSSTVDRIRNVAQRNFEYAVNNPRKQGLNRMQLGKDAEIQATRWTRKWAERNGIDLSDSGLHFQVRGDHSIPDIVYEPTKNIMDFKLTPKAIRKKQSDNFKSDFPGYSIEYIFGPGPWRE